MGEAKEQPQLPDDEEYRKLSGLDIYLTPVFAITTLSTPSSGGASHEWQQDVLWRLPYHHSRSECQAHKLLFRFMSYLIVLVGACWP